MEQKHGKTLDSRKLAVMKSPALYGVSLRYNKANWMAEMGTENPFTHKIIIVNTLVQMPISMSNQELVVYTSKPLM